jgi:hypothetical protein
MAAKSTEAQRVVLRDLTKELELALKGHGSK